MIQSMTGYGKASAEFQGKKINAEVKSLNSKALDLSTRLAPIYREKEMEVRALIAQALERGKVEFNLWIEQTEAQNAASINGELVANYYKQITDIAEKYDIDEPEDIWTALLRMPDVLSKTEVQELTEEEWAVAKGVVEKAIQQLVDFRKQEGLALQKKFEEKLDNIAALLASIEPFETIAAVLAEENAEPGGCAAIYSWSGVRPQPFGTGDDLLHRETGHQRGETASDQPPPLLPPDHGGRTRTR